MHTLLFNNFREILQDCEQIKINRMSLNNIRYADDSVIIATSIEDLQYLRDLNITKPKPIIIRKTNTPTISAITLVEHSQLLTYLRYLSTYSRFGD